MRHHNRLVVKVKQRFTQSHRTEEVNFLPRRKHLSIKIQLDSVLLVGECWLNKDFFFSKTCLKFKENVSKQI